MRIVGGRLRGRRIAVPKDGVRPTSERVREALMSILGPDWDERRVLDGYAGSGAFGFEALSRGAAHVTFVERDSRTSRRIQQTADDFGVAEHTRLVRDDVTRALRSLRRQGERFDLLFFDPPYADSDAETVLSLAVGLAKTGAALVWECGADGVVPEAVGDWSRCECRRYGSTSVAIYRRRTESD